MMWSWMLPLTVLSLCTYTASVTRFSDCESNLGTLERALFETGGNLFELNRVFFPPSLLTTRFIRVNYTFIDENELETCTNVTYIWAIGQVLFMQPPTLFKINSMFFYYPSNDLTTLSLWLPIECIGLINGTDGECSCINDSHMLDVLTQQLNIYAKFTNQANVERSNTFTRAVCAGELYDTYYSGKSSDINYIIAAATIVGPLPLLLLGLVFIVLNTALKLKKYAQEKETSSILRTTKRKNIAALALVGIYISIYILILDILAVHIVRTSKHEYEPELSERTLPFNLGVTYSTLACDLLFCIMFLLIPSVIILAIKLLPTSKSSAGDRSTKENSTEKHLTEKTAAKKIPVHYKLIESFKDEDGKKDLISFLFPLYLVAPVMCIVSHLGYILLAWITEPSRSTTTLILYYFLFCYLYLIFRKSYKMGTQLYKFSKSKPKVSQIVAHEIELADVNEVKSVAAPAKVEGEQQASQDIPKQSKDGINVCIFFLNIILGLVYLGLAVIFTMIVYVMPLASEDLFSYLFNVIQFMIVVVSTQFVYTLLAGKKFSFKGVLKHVKSITDDYRKDFKDPDPKDLNKNTNIVEETSDFIARKLLIPHMIQNKDTIAKVTLRKK